MNSEYYRIIKLYVKKNRNRKMVWCLEYNEILFPVHLYIFFVFFFILFFTIAIGMIEK